MSPAQPQLQPHPPPAPRGGRAETQRKAETGRGAETEPGAWAEKGAGTVMALAIIAVALSLALVAIGLIQAQGAAGRARQAADLAALAGATVLNSVTAPGDPCAMAQQVAHANGATTTGCQVNGEDVKVDVAVNASVLGIPRTAAASARAGPVNPL